MKKITAVNISSLIIILIISFQTYYAQNGIVKSYFPDGTIQSEISYVNDVLDGASITYFSNGKIWIEKNYSRGILDGFVREYYESGKLKEEYFVQNGVKEGAFRRYFSNGELEELLSYSYGQLINKQRFKPESDNRTADETAAALSSGDPMSIVNGNKNFSENELNTSAGDLKIEKTEIAESAGSEDYIVCDAQECPIPLGGMKAILDSLAYPEHALRYGLEGTVKIIATVNQEGIVLRTQVLSGIGLGCDEAAQEAVRKTKFIPGKSKGLAVETNATISVEFKIPGK